MHLDNSSKLNLERNLRKSRPKKKEDLALQEYEASVDDPRAIVDPELELEADKIGMIHSRKHTSETEMLPGYGTTNFGVSAYQEKKILTPTKIAVASGVATTGLLLWSLKDRIASGLGVVANYALLLRESYRS